MRSQPFELIDLFQSHRIDWNRRKILHDPIVYDLFYPSIVWRKLKFKQIIIALVLLAIVVLERGYE